MAHKEFSESISAKFKRKHKPVEYNPIRPLNYPKDHVHTILRDSAVRSNALKNKKRKGKLDGIEGMFCCDAARYDGR